MPAPPKYYRISLDPPPARIATLSTLGRNYSWEYLGLSPHKCEISFLQEGSLSEMRPDGEHTYEQGSVFTVVDNRVCLRYCKEPVFHEYYLRFYVSSLPVPVDEEFVAGWFTAPHEAILPEHITDPAVCRQLEALIKSTAGLAESDTVGRGLRMRACLYDCLFLLTRSSVEEARSRLQHIPNQRSRYTELACAYIREHLNERIRVEDVAKAAGVSYNHLKSLFCRDMKMNLVEYINREKIRLVEAYVTTQGMTLEKAGEAVGLPDAKYLSKLFHRCTGMSVREYRRIYSQRTEYKLE